MICFLFLFFFSLLYFSSSNGLIVFFSFLQILRETVHKHLTPDPQKYGLDTMTLAFSDHKLHVCPGHAQTWQASKEITEVSVEGPVSQIKISAILTSLLSPLTPPPPTHTHMHAHMHSHSQTPPPPHTHTHLHPQTCTHAHTHTQTLICIHTHTCTHTHTSH